MFTFKSFLINCYSFFYEGAHFFIRENLADIFWILVLFLIGKTALKMIVKRLVSVTNRVNDRLEKKNSKRTETLGQVVISVGNIVIYTIILFMTLELFNVDIKPILAGAGVVGLAIGFGSQALVKDFVSGLFILIENQYGIGDQVKIGSFEGRVIKITMRSTVLETDKGEVCYMPNGEIKNVVNMSQL